MNVDLIQNLRYKLQKRVRRLSAVNGDCFHTTLKHFLTFLQGRLIFVGILEQLLIRYPEAPSKTAEIQILDDEFENAAYCYSLLKNCADSSNENAELNIGHRLTSGNNDDAATAFRITFVEPVYEYLDEQLDDQRAILALLRRYKHKCESYQRKQLYDLWAGDTKKGEKSLAFHLYEYLHDQGINLTIEPYSESGEVDMVAAQNTEDPLIADAKIFNPEKSKGKPYVCHGFHQIYQYTLDYNEPFGYLVIFKTCPEDLKFALTGQEQSVPFVVHNHKTIFLLTIDIFPHDKPASKRGYLKSYEITQEELSRSAEVQCSPEPAPQAAPTIEADT